MLVSWVVDLLLMIQVLVETFKSWICHRLWHRLNFGSVIVLYYGIFEIILLHKMISFLVAILVL